MIFTFVSKLCKKRSKALVSAKGKWPNAQTRDQAQTRQKLRKNETQELVLGVKDSTPWNKNDKWAG